MKSQAQVTAQFDTPEGGGLALRGALTFETVPDLWKHTARVLTTNGDATLDLAGVDRIDSAGLALLVAWQAKAQAVGRTLRYSAIPERLRALARISEVDALL